MSSNVDFPTASPDAGVRPDHPCRSGAQVIDGPAGLVERRRDKIAIVGYASTRVLAPFNDPEFEICGLNQLYRFIERADFWADTHAYWEESNVEGTDHRAWIRDCGIPVLMTEHHPELPTSVRFPIERCIAIGADYFTSTISHLVAWAILQGYKTIALYGIDLVVGTEYECVAPDTRVLTADLRWTPAGMLQVGDRLIGFDEEPASPRHGRFYRTAVVTGADRIEKPCSRLRLADGTTIVASDDHPWLTHSLQHRWRKTADLATPHHRRPSRLVKVVNAWGQPVHSWDAGYLAAAFDGEGTLRGSNSLKLKHNRVTFAQRENEMAATVERALSRYEYRWAKGGGRGSGAAPTYGWTVSGGRSETLRFLGQIRPQRLLGLFDPGRLGRLHALATVPVVAVEPVGVCEVVALGTSTRTFIAEGFATHNTQKACAEFWLGVAHGRDVEIRLPAECALLKHSHRYGWEREPDWGPVKLSEFEARQRDLIRQRDGLLTKLHALDGALHEVTRYESWKDDPETRIKWLRELHGTSMANLATIDGAAQEVTFWKDVLLLRSRGAGVQLRQHALQ